MNKITVWIKSARPKTLWASISPVMLGLALAYSIGSFQIFAAFATLFSAIFIQIGTNYANDYFDFKKGVDNEKRVGFERATQSGLVTPKEMLCGTIIAFAIAILFGFYLILCGGLPILIIGIISIICGVLYTAGPFPLGYIGLGEVFVFIFFGPVAVCGTYYIQTHNFTLESSLAGFAPGFISIAILTVNNYRDYDNDKESGKKTLIVRFGKLFGQIEYIFVLVLAFLIPIIYYIYFKQNSWLFLSLVGLMFCIYPIKSILYEKNLINLNKTLADTGKILLIHTLCFSAGLIL